MKNIVKTGLIAVLLFAGAGAAVAHREGNPEVRGEARVSFDAGAKLETMKKRFKAFIEQLKTRYQNMKSRIHNNPNISAEAKVKLEAYLDGRIQLLAGFEAKVEAADSATELMQLRAELAGFNKMSIKGLREMFQNRLNERFEKALLAAKNRLASLREKVKDAKEDGKDVKNAEKLLGNCETHIKIASDTDHKNIKASLSVLSKCYQDFRKVVVILTGDVSAAIEDGNQFHDLKKVDR